MTFPPFSSVTVAIALAATAGRAAADMPATDPSAQALRSLFAAPASSAALFSPEFTRDVPPDRIAKYVAFYENAIGTPPVVTKDDQDYAITGPRGSIRAAIRLDANGTIAALRFHDEVSPVNADALKRVLQANVLVPDWFAQTAQRDAAVAHTQKVIDGLHTALGKYVRLETRHGAYVAVFERGETHAQVSADNSGRIVYLSFERG